MKNMLLLSIALLTSILAPANTLFNTLQQAITIQDQEAVMNALEEPSHLTLYNKRLLEELAQYKIGELHKEETLLSNDNYNRLSIGLIGLAGALAVWRSPASKTTVLKAAAFTLGTVGLYNLANYMVIRSAVAEYLEQNLKTAHDILQAIRSAQTI